MARKSGNGAAAGQEQLPVQPVEKPIICNPYDEPQRSLDLRQGDGRGQPRRDAPPRELLVQDRAHRQRAVELSGLAEEERDDLPLVNAPARGRAAGGASTTTRRGRTITRDLLRHWARPDRGRRLFFCQREAVETIMYLFEFRIWKTKRLPFKPALSDDDLARLLAGDAAIVQPRHAGVLPAPGRPVAGGRHRGAPAHGGKMATGSGKTVVMSMLIAWAFCNRGQNEASAFFPNGVLICCPNLTVKERLQVLRPERPDNYYEQFDIVPVKYRPLLQAGKVLVTNWHRFAPESEHVENGKATPW